MFLAVRDEIHKIVLMGLMSLLHGRL